MRDRALLAVLFLAGCFTVLTGCPANGQHGVIALNEARSLKSGDSSHRPIAFAASHFATNQ